MTDLTKSKAFIINNLLCGSVERVVKIVFDSSFFI